MRTLAPLGDIAPWEASMMERVYSNCGKLGLVQGTILKLLLHKFMDVFGHVMIFMTETFSAFDMHIVLLHLPWALSINPWILSICSDL